MAKPPARHPNQIDLFPPVSDWKPRDSLPTIPDGVVVAIDCETRDEGLNKGVGPGWAHDDGWLSGISFAWAGDADYLPIKEPDTTCFSREQVDSWLKDVERRCTLVFQNATYDLGWTGLRTTKRIYDTHAAAVLIDENKFNYSLDAICADLKVPGKDEAQLREVAATMGVNPKSEMWKIPARFKAKYATQDAVATLGAHNAQAPLILGQDLGRAYEIECRLIPHIRDMRARGIRVDVNRAEELMVKFAEQRDAVLVNMKQHTTIFNRRTPTMDDVRSPRWLQDQFDDLKIEYPRTPGTRKNPNGNPSFEKDWLMAQEHPLPRAISEARKLDDCSVKFVGNYILGYVHRGRMHAEINQLRDADGESSKGTRSYRFSYGNPPLQQMVRPDPDRADPEHKDYREGFVDAGTEIRSCFLPEEGEIMGAPDYSQQEYRWIVIYSDLLKLPGADAAVRQYQNDESTDFHNYVKEITGLTRKRAKDANFAKAFGAGIPKFAMMTGMTLAEAESTMNTYDTELPFVKLLAEKCKQVADTRGYIRLLEGYRARFDTWECAYLDKHLWTKGVMEGQKMAPCSQGEAIGRTRDKEHVWFGKRLRRAETRVAGNREIQGSAAVQTKKALLEQADAGMLPLLQMHDELVHSVPSRRYATDIAQIMRDVVKRKVPFKVDAEFGHTWGHCKKSYDEAMSRT